MKLNHLLYGGDYNPEQWLYDNEIFIKDIKLMKEAKINCVTLGMFSWSTLEPEEGAFNFGWLEEILDKLLQNGIFVILGTPSGAKPNWLGNKYEEVRIVKRNGIRELQGNRHNFCPNSKIYRKKISIIDKKLALLSLKYPNIILWHISNEFGEVCHCDLCLKKFRKWLKKKYKTIENLNYSWWTTFWSHNYRSFDEITFPLEYGEKSITALNINYLQFITENFIDFFNFEKSIIKKINDRLPFTTNYHGNGNNNINYNIFSKFVDVISYDSYPEWMFRNNIEVAFETSFMYELMKGGNLDKPFLLMESSPSATNWQLYSKLKPPKLLIIASLQAISHGSMGVLFFQIRQSRGSAEKFHGAVIGNDGSNKSRVFKECKELGKYLTKLSYSFEKKKAKVGLYFSWLNKYAIESSQGPRNKGMNYYKNITQIYKILKSFWLDVDIIWEESNLEEYDLIILPMVYVLEKKYADNLKKVVEKGKTLITIAPFGYVNSDDLFHTGVFPGYLKEVLGIEINEIDAIMENEESYIEYKDQLYKNFYYNELITLKTAKAIGSYKEFFYKGSSAITKNNYGKGKAYHIGSILEKEGFKSIFKDIITDLGIVLKTCNENIIFNEYNNLKYFFNFGTNYEEIEINNKKFILAPIDYLILNEKGERLWLE